MVAETPQLTREQVHQAAANYMDCLALPPRSQVLFVTDRISRDEILSPAPDKNRQVRIAMTKLLKADLAKRAPAEIVRFGHGMDDQDMRTQMADALQRLDEIGEAIFEEDRTTTVVYLGADWTNRGNMYDAIESFADTKDRGKVRVAGSLGFTTGDARVMSHIGPEERSTIRESSEYIKSFFLTHPHGLLQVLTEDFNGKNHELSVPYNTKPAPLLTELGYFDPDEVAFNRNFVYVNIPGGESFFTPYPYRETHGKFAAEGMLFTVDRGMVIGVEILDQEALISPRQRQLIEILQSGKHVPIAEFGMGLYKFAEIETYKDSSTLSSEKSGPHVGVGHTYATDEEEKKAIDSAAAAVGFHHGDMVLDNARINLENLGTHEPIPLYPSQDSHS